MSYGRYFEELRPGDRLLGGELDTPLVQFALRAVGGPVGELQRLPSK